VLDGQLKAVDKQLAAARDQLAKAQQQLAIAEKKAPIDAKVLAQAKATAVVAEKLIAAGEHNMVALKARAAADQTTAREPATTKAKELARQAAIEEKQQAVLQAEVALARAHEKNAPAEVKAATATRDAAQKGLANPGDVYTPLAGALKTLENNLETEASRRKPFPKTSTGRRSALAKWIANEKNPLTARVAVNHMWARHFGQPLVPSVFDFGRKGTPPTHPELLDWLAVELMEHGWSMKHLHKLMVTSNVYRMSSSFAGAPAANRQADGDNHFLWHMNSGRMESQVVRDSLAAPRSRSPSKKRRNAAACIFSTRPSTATASLRHSTKPTPWNAIAAAKVSCRSRPLPFPTASSPSTCPRRSPTGSARGWARWRTVRLPARRSSPCFRVRRRRPSWVRVNRP
jgi:hypothetical protein